MKTFSSFMSRILPHVAGCPDATAEEALLDTAIEFCEKTLILQQTLDPVGTQEGESEYELDAPSQLQVIMPVAVWFKTTLMQPVPAHMVRNVQAYNQQVPGYTSIEGDPRWYFWVSPQTIGVYPVAKTSEGFVLTVRAALKPARNATKLEDVLYEDWLDVLVAGTLARLHSMKDQPWASADRALLKSREFRAGVQRARMEGSIGRVRASLSVRMRGF